MYDSIKSFPKQFLFDPKVEGGNLPAQLKRVVVLGMGGSALAAKLWKWNFHSFVWRDYGLPQAAYGNALVIASSYSGNTEEVLDGYDAARAKRLNLAVVAAGGKLLEKAKSDSVPYVIIPDTGIQPRMAIGYSFLALLKLMGREEEIAEARKLADALDINEAEQFGMALAEKIAPRLPIVYASAQNEALAYTWKIMFNETGKIPAFYNVLPELNHNEMNSFDVHPHARDFHFLIFRDHEDHPRVQKRMDVLGELYCARGLSVDTVMLDGATRMEKIFTNFLRGACISYYTAKHYGADPENVPIIEEFKRML